MTLESLKIQPSGTGHPLGTAPLPWFIFFFASGRALLLSILCWKVWLKINPFHEAFWRFLNHISPHSDPNSQGLVWTAPQICFVQWVVATCLFLPSPLLAHTWVKDRDQLSFMSPAKWPCQQEGQNNVLSVSKTLVRQNWKIETFKKI